MDAQPATTVMPSNSVLDQTLGVLYAARTELILFCLAFALHHFLFGNAFSRRAKTPSVRKKLKKAPHLPDGEDDPGAAAAGPISALRCSQAAYDRGDHRAVLRCWASLRKSSQVPATHLAQVVESMQRFKKDSSEILSEVRAHLERKATRDIAYVNRLLEPLTRSLDTEVVNGIFDALPALGIEADAGTYEALIQMHFTTRSFDLMSELATEMRAKGIAPTSRANLALLKAALQMGNLDRAICYYQEVATLSAGMQTASVAPRHLAMQLVELACREHCAEAVLGHLEDGQLPFTTEMLNVLLGEAARTKDRALAERVERLGAQQGIEKNGRTYQLLVRCASNDRDRIRQLLSDMAARGVECSLEVVQAVLTACSSTIGNGGDTSLADQLCEQLRPEQTVQVPALLALIRFYADVGQPEKACNIYEKHLKVRSMHDGDLRKRALIDARTERCLVNAALQCGRQGLATKLLETAPADTAKHIAIIRSCASKGNLDEAISVFHTLKEGGAELTHSLWNTTLDACVECRDLRRAELLMKQMEAAGVADAVSFNTLIKAHLRHENYDRARALMQEMRKTAQSAPNHVTYNELINTLARSEKEVRRTQVWDVVEEMGRAGVKPNHVTCSILLKSLKAKSSHADVTRTMELTNTMAEPMDEVLLSSVVEACVRVGKPGLLAQKLEQLERSDSITVTGAHTFGSLIKAYGYVRNIAGAWRCWKEMRSQHIKPTSITIGCMVEAVVTNGDVDGGYELVSSLLEDDVCREQVNAVIFGSVLKGYGRARRMERVWVVFKEMLSRGIEPSVVTFNAMIDSCARNGQMDRVAGLLEEMRARWISPNLITYSTMIKGWSQRGDMPAALATLEDLRKSPDLRPDEIVYNTLLDGCSQAGLLSEGERLFRQMQAEGVQPSNYTLTVLVKLMGQGHSVDRAFELVEAATQRHGFRANSHVTGALIQACLQGRDLPRAVATYERAVRERAQPEMRACQALVRAILAAGQQAQAVSLLRTMLGLNGGSQSGLERSSSGIDDAFLGQVLSTLNGSGGTGASLAAALQADLRNWQPPQQQQQQQRPSRKGGTGAGRRAHGD